VLEFSTEGQAKRAASITAAAQAFGLAAALLLGGGLTQYAPWPTHLSLWALFALIALLLTATWFLPRYVSGQASNRWRPKVPTLPPGLWPAFALASIAVTTAYAHGVLILSLGGQVARDLVGSPNALVNGTALSLFAITFGVLGIVGRDLRPRPAMMLGAIASSAGMGLLALSVAWHGLSIFLAATALSGAGYSLLFIGGLALISSSVPAKHRGGVLSALYLFAYLSQGIVALVLGAVATQRGLGLAVNLGAGIITLLSLVTIGLIVTLRMSANAQAARPSTSAASAVPVIVARRQRQVCLVINRATGVDHEALPFNLIPQLSSGPDFRCRERDIIAAPASESGREGTVLGPVQDDQSATAGAGARSRRWHNRH
jgi:MFS family permease